MGPWDREFVSGARAMHGSPRLPCCTALPLCQQLARSTLSPPPPPSRQPTGTRSAASSCPVSCTYRRARLLSTRCPSLAITRWVLGTRVLRPLPAACKPPLPTEKPPTLPHLQPTYRTSWRCARRAGPCCAATACRRRRTWRWCRTCPRWRAACLSCTSSTASAPRTRSTRCPLALVTEALVSV